MPLNSVFHNMIFAIITAYENEVFNTLCRPQFKNTCYLGWFVRYAQLYGIRRCLIGVGSITEVKQHHNWMDDRLGLPGAVYTATSCSDVVSWGSENHVNQMARLTDFELDVKDPQWT